MASKRSGGHGSNALHFEHQPTPRKGALLQAGRDQIPVVCVRKGGCSEVQIAPKVKTTTRNLPVQLHSMCARAL